MNLNQIGALVIVLAIIYYLFREASHNYQRQQALKNSPTGLVKHFGVSLEIADLPHKHAEGGFYLFFENPELNIRKMLVYNFEKGSTIVGTFDLDDRYIDWETFRLTLNNSKFFCQSPNKYNAQKVEVFGILHNGQKFHAEKNVDPEVDRTDNQPILLDNLNFQFL